MTFIHHHNTLACIFIESANKSFICVLAVSLGSYHLEMISNNILSKSLNRYNIRMQFNTSSCLCSKNTNDVLQWLNPLHILFLWIWTIRSNATSPNPNVFTNSSKSFSNLFFILSIHDIKSNIKEEIVVLITTWFSIQLLHWFCDIILSRSELNAPEQILTPAWASIPLNSCDE